MCVVCVMYVCVLYVYVVCVLYVCAVCYACVCCVCYMHVLCVYVLCICVLCVYAVCYMCVLCVLYVCFMCVMYMCIIHVCCVCCMCVLYVHAMCVCVFSPKALLILIHWFSNWNYCMSVYAWVGVDAYKRGFLWIIETMADKSKMPWALSTLFSEARSITEPEVSVWPGWLVTGLQESTCLCSLPPMLGYNVGHWIQLLHGCLGPKPRASRLYGRHWPNHLLSPIFPNNFKISWSYLAHGMSELKGSEESSWLALVLNRWGNCVKSLSNEQCCYSSWDCQDAAGTAASRFTVRLCVHVSAAKVLTVQFA